MSKRQERKNARAGKRDKNGFSMSLSRCQRRAAWRLMLSQCYQSTKGGVIRLNAGEHAIKDNIGASDHYLYGGGSVQCH